MSTAFEDPATLALQRFHQRVTRFCEQAAYDRGAYDWATVIAQEAAIMVQQGPLAYLGYVDHLDDAAVRAELDRELQHIFDNPQTSTPPTDIRRVAPPTHEDGPATQ